MAVIDLKAKKKWLNGALGALVGVVNGLLGAGGGMLAVPFLRKSGIRPKEAHVNAVAVILPIAAVSTFLYWNRGSVRAADVWVFIPGGLLGSLLATQIMKWLSVKWIRLLFALFLIWAGIRAVAV